MLHFCIFINFQPLKENKFVISKSRYASIDSYLSPCAEKYNDNDLTYDKAVYEQLKDAGMVVAWW